MFNLEQNRIPKILPFLFPEGLFSIRLFVYFLIAIAAGLIAFCIGYLPFPILVVIPIVIIAFFVVIATISFPILGFYILLILSYFNNFFLKTVPFPIGTTLDAMLLLLLIISLVKLIRNRDFKIFNHTIALFLLVWIAYCLIQFLNPWANSRMAWLVGIRMMGIYHIIPIVLALTIVNVKQVYHLVYFIIFLSVIASIYGLKQEYLGFSQMELNWLYADPTRFNLIVIWSRFRTFSVFSDPTTFGIVMAIGALMCIVFSLNSRLHKWIKMVLIGLAVIMILNMFYSGARTPFIILPFGIALLVIMRQKIKEIVILGFLLIAAIVWLSSSTTNNPLLARMKTAFYPIQDPSFQVRLENQNYIQPYILSHPIGGGIGSTGIIGQRFSPHTQLGNFPPDSFYVQIAVETGIIGLLLYLILMWVIFRHGASGYFKTDNPRFKTLYLSFIIVIFMITIANYPQQATLYAPINMIYYFVIGMIIRLNSFDGLNSKFTIT